MNVVVWIVTVLLALLFAMAGLGKVLQPREKMLEKMPWVARVPIGSVRALGAAEMLGAVGLVLPGAFDVAPVLVPVAAVCLAVTMVGATVLHAVRGERQAAIMTAVLTVLSVFVAVMRFGPEAF